MLRLTAAVRVFVARGATDLRRSFDRLSAQVQEVLGHAGLSKARTSVVYRGAGGEVVYDFTWSRNRDGPWRMLANYRGYLQVDAAPAYDEVFAQHPEIIEVGCMAHARRYFKEALPCAQALALIGQLYKIERSASDRNLDGSARQRLRHGIGLAQSFIVGDRWRDIEAGRQAGCTTILIDYGYAEELKSQPDLWIRSLKEAAAWIIAQSRSFHGHRSTPKASIRRLSQGNVSS